MAYPKSTPALTAAREERALHKFKDDDADVTASFVVSTLADIYHDICRRNAGCH